MATSEETNGTTCLLEEPPPKSPRPSSGSPRSFLLQCVIFCFLADTDYLFNKIIVKHEEVMAYYV